MSEEWRDIPGYEGHYQVSNLGRVKSVSRDVPRSDGKPYRRREFIRKLVPTPQGYYGLTLNIYGLRETRLVHHLVAAAFIGPRPDGMYVCHNDGDRTNNQLENLRYDTPSANAHDMRRHGTSPQLNRTHCPRNHPYDDVNTYIYKGHRYCRPCQRAAASRYKAQKRKTRSAA